MTKVKVFYNIQIYNNVLWDCQYLMEYSHIFPDIIQIESGKNVGICCEILSVPRNNVMDLNIVMLCKLEWSVIKTL